ncbi:uncharacterized protein LOC578301 isoform X2 [Strongylocentrotus purpuratus]|uniref:Uncharacterized protein n=1 Tax=Strongylocentrotus purpuratus TaxID=7668 RepID=A0A7M7RFR4_STRPU|nr:uncharacterized protein LOC578301 isoform X2 [Strongylocentrotus purpuratus]|eukprot:XP_799992.2 PREDICTED: uncharacterized protein LOC578301 isoform X2 [Strongylocentrotus purpuratus]
MMRGLHLAFVLLFTILVLYSKDCEAQCAPEDAKAWDPVRNESTYDRDPASINQPDGRPLGYQLDTLDYINDANARSPCVTVTGCINYVDIMVETDPLARICIEDITTDAATRELICQERISSCVPCPSEEVTYQFSCQGSSCDQSAVNFWFRFVLSDPAVLDPELWCFNRNTDEYPSSLYNNVPVPVTRAKTMPTGRGTSLGATFSLTLCAFLTVIFIARQ